MAQYDVTSILERAEALGLTIEDLIAAVPGVSRANMTENGHLVRAITSNRRADGACDEWIDKMEAAVVRHAQAATPTAAIPATERQIEYVITLLNRRRLNGEGSGFMSLNGLYREDGAVNIPAVQMLSRTAASQVIDSLTEQY